VRGLPFGLVVAGTALVGVATALAAVRLPATPGEARLAEAAVAAVGPARAAPVTVGLDQLAARVQLSTYAELTGAFPRHVTALAGARELALLACASLLLALLALVRSLGVRPPAALLVLSVLAVCPPAVAALARFGPGLLGVTWLTVGAALLARLRPGLRMIGLPAVVVGVVSAPVLAVLVSLAARGPATVADLPPVPGDDPGVLRHRAVLVGIDAPARAWLAAQRPPYQPTVSTTANETVVTWPVPGPGA
jgi:hypothetical protein